MPNNFPATCYRCGEKVAPGEGVVENSGSRRSTWGRFRQLPKFLVQHHECAKQWGGTKQHHQYNDLRKKGLDNARSD